MPPSKRDSYSKMYQKQIAIMAALSGTIAAFIILALYGFVSYIPSDQLLDSPLGFGKNTGVPSGCTRSEATGWNYYCYHFKSPVSCENQACLDQSQIVTVSGTVPISLGSTKGLGKTVDIAVYDITASQEWSDNYKPYPLGWTCTCPYYPNKCYPITSLYVTVPSPFQTTWDSTTVPNGHIVQILARSYQGSIDKDAYPLCVQVQN
ncbi:MAG: hypothetical protein V1847_03395 [Candidatus Diapherotrites archaeon]